MKKRILALSMVLALVAAMVMPMAAFAGGEVGIDVPGILAISNPSGDPDAVLPEVITGFGFTGATGVTVEGTGVAVTGFSFVSDTEVHATFTVEAVADTTAGSYDVTVVGCTVGDLTKADGFAINTYTTVAAPANIDLGTVLPGAAKVSGLVAGVVATNASTWQVSAVDATIGANKGFMVSGATPLKAKLMIGKTVDPAPSTSADTAITYSSGDTVNIPFVCSQAIHATDDGPGHYTITITFSVSTP